MTIGIYSITNKKTNQKYIGQSIDIERRIREHKKFLKKNNHHNIYLQRSFNKYGEENFIFSVIETFNKKTPFLKEVLNDAEEYYVKWYQTFKKGFNLTNGGDGAIMKPEILKQKSQKQTQTGFYKILKKHDENLVQGFCYLYKDSSSQICIARKNLSDLRDALLEKNIKITIVDKEKAKKTLEFEKKKDKTNEVSNRKRSFTQNTTGYRRVSKQKNRTCKNGFIYSYRYYEGNKRKKISRVDIDSLKKEVIKRGLVWEEFDGK